MEENEKEDASVSAKLDRIIELLESLQEAVQEEAQAIRDCIRAN